MVYAVDYLLFRFAFIGLLGIFGRFIYFYWLKPEVVAYCWELCGAWVNCDDKAAFYPLFSAAYCFLSEEFRNFIGGFSPSLFVTPYLPPRYGIFEICMLGISGDENLALEKPSVILLPFIILRDGVAEWVAFAPLSWLPYWPFLFTTRLAACFAGDWLCSYLFAILLLLWSNVYECSIFSKIMFGSLTANPAAVDFLVYG